MQREYAERVLEYFEERFKAGAIQVVASDFVNDRYPLPLPPTADAVMAWMRHEAQVADLTDELAEALMGRGLATFPVTTRGEVAWGRGRTKAGLRKIIESDEVFELYLEKSTKTARGVLMRRLAQLTNARVNGQIPEAYVRSLAGGFTMLPQGEFGFATEASDTAA